MEPCTHVTRRLRTASGNAALGRHRWSGPPGPGDELLAAWAALALQVVGESLLVEDCSSSAVTRGYLPPVWSLVVRPVHLDGKRLEVTTEFASEVSAAEARSTGTFVRRIVRGPFVRTGRMGYEVRPA